MPNLITYARQIAQDRGYPVLVNGLQPLEDYEFKGEHRPGLLTKYSAERAEFRDAYSNKSRLHILHEAADVLYYASQIEAQSGTVSVHEALAWLADYGVSKREAERAAEAKYGYRVSHRKDEQKELKLIEEALK